MDRSRRAADWRRFAWLLMALALLAGCQSKAPAPATVAEEHLQRRAADAAPAPLPEQTAEKAEAAPLPEQIAEKAGAVPPPLLAEKPGTGLVQPSSIDPRTFEIQNER